MRNIIKLYNKALQVHPWKTQSLTTGFLMGTSDVIAQTLIERRKIEEVELHRIVRFAALGTCFVAPVIRSWYIVLERMFGAIGKTVGLKKMLCDQLMFTPCFIGGFLTVFNTTQFQPWHVIKAKVKQDYFTILKSNYKLWPATQLITFYIIPFHMRIVFVSLVALFWNTYLAYVANRQSQ